MDASTLQALLVPLIVALAALALGRRVYRFVGTMRRKSDDGCGGGCCGKE